MRNLYALALLVVFTAAAQAQSVNWDDGAKVDWDCSPTPAPLPPAPKPKVLWEARQNGWHQSTITGHYWHGYWGHRDKDTDWASWFPTAAELADCNAWLRDHGHPELPNQHHPPHQPPAPAYLKTYTMPAYQMPSYQMKGYMMPSRPMKFGRAGGSC